MFLLDTNVVSYFVRHASTHLDQRILDSNPEQLAISVISAGELQYGLSRLGTTRRALTLRKELIALFKVIKVSSLPAEASSHYVAARAALDAAGTPIGGNDLWIAAHALAADMTLVTNNVREFERVPGLKTENWLNP